MTSHMFRISKKGNWTNDRDFIVHDFLEDIFFPEKRFTVK